MKDNKNENIILSICIPVYNGGNHVIDLTERILSSPNNQFEIIINDNCSEDNTSERLNTIHDDRLFVYKNESTVPPFQNWYKTLSRGNGKYLMLLQDNDELIVKNLNAYIEFLKKNDFVFLRNGPSLFCEADKYVDSFEYIMDSVKLSHASRVVYKKDYFCKFIPHEDSFDVRKTAYSYIFWDLQIINENRLFHKVGYINNKIKIMYIPPRGEGSRTRPFYDEKMEYINYTFEGELENFLQAIIFMKEIGYSGKESLDMCVSLYRVFLYRATHGYYAWMRNRRDRNRAGVPVNGDSKSDWVKRHVLFYEKSIKCITDSGYNNEKISKLLIPITLRSCADLLIKKTSLKSNFNWFFMLNKNVSNISKYIMK